MIRLWLLEIPKARKPLEFWKIAPSAGLHARTHHDALFTVSLQEMASAMQLYAGFALVVIAIIAIIALAAIVSNLIGVLRRRSGRTGASRLATLASRSEDPRASR